MIVDVAFYESHSLSEFLFEKNKIKVSFSSAQSASRFCPSHAHAVAICILVLSITRSGSNALEMPDFFSIFRTYLYLDL